MNRLLNDEMFLEEKQFSGGKIAMFMTQEDREEEKAQLTAKGGTRRGWAGRAGPPPKTGLGPLRRFRFGRLGLLTDSTRRRWGGGYRV